MWINSPVAPTPSIREEEEFLLSSFYRERWVSGSRHSFRRTDHHAWNNRRHGRGSPDFPNSPYKRRRRIFYCLLSIEGDEGGCPVSATPPVTQNRLAAVSWTCSTNHPEGLTCLSLTGSRAEGGGCQPCQCDFHDFSYPSLFIGKSG